MRSRAKSETAGKAPIRYGGIDGMKLVAALLVVAIHTGPLLSFDAYADFLVTGIVARVAVPFFFVASAFLLFRKFTDNERENGRLLRRYVGKVAVLYVIAIIIYLPVNVYKDDFGEGVAAQSLARDLLIDGTFYHLWYLPALLTGVCLVYGLRLLRLSPAAIVMTAMLLYAIGLLGDSYYGLAAEADALSKMYDIMFGWFDYTRNGLFFAPIYVALGLWAAKKPASEQRRSRRETQDGPQRQGTERETQDGPQYGTERETQRETPHWPPRVVRRRTRSWVPLAVSMAALILEGVLLREAGYPRHDSMYIMLVPAVYALFRLTLDTKARFGPFAGAMSQWIYILHPAVIIGVRGAAKALGLQELLVSQSLVHFGAVSVLSVVIAALIAVYWPFRRRRVLQDFN